MFAVRITRDFESLKPFFDKVIDKHPNSVLVVFQHDADEDVSRTHVHALMENVNPSTDTLKRWVKEVVGPVHKSDWSFKKYDGDSKFITYMSKGKLDPLLLHNIKHEEVTALRSEWKETREKRPEREKREDVTVFDLAKELADWIDLDKSDRVWKDAKTGNFIHCNVDDRDVVLKCIELHKKYKKTFCDFSLVRVIQTAYGIATKEDFRGKLVAKVLEKLSVYST